MTRRPSRDGHLELEEEGWMEVRRLSGGESSVRLSKEDGDFQFVCHRLGDILEVGILGVQVEEHL